MENEIVLNIKNIDVPEIWCRKGKIMKQNKTKTLLFVLFLSLLFAFTGCGKKENEDPAEPGIESAAQTEDSIQSEDRSPSKDTLDVSPSADQTAALENDGSGTGTIELEVCFGDDGEPFILHLYDNDTAAAIAHHVGTASWRLPIYHYDDYDNWESMQYYDIPSRYEIPSDAKTVISAKGGEVYYSEPNRIVLFYHDAEISAEYTKVGYFDYTDEFVAAVENNPVLEGWDTKMVLIQSMD